MKSSEAQLASARAYYASHREERIAYGRLYYAEHREECCTKQRQYHDDTGKSRVADRRHFLGLMKDGVGCRGCGTTSKLDFHHRDRATKAFNVSDRVMAPWSVLMTEIFKCDVLCRPCHNARRVAEDKLLVV